MKDFGVAEVTGQLALSKLICDRQTVIKRFVLGLGSMVSGTSYLVYKWGPEASWVWAGPNPRGRGN